MLAIAVDPQEHQIFTNAWRTLIPYGGGTFEATVEDVMQAARTIYANQPQVLKALGL